MKVAGESSRTGIECATEFNLRERHFDYGTRLGLDGSPLAMLRLPQMATDRDAPASLCDLDLVQLVGQLLGIQLSENPRKRAAAVQRRRRRRAV